MINPEFIYPGFIDEVKGALNQGGGSGGSGGSIDLSGDPIIALTKSEIITPVVNTNGALFTDKTGKIFSL